MEANAELIRFVLSSLMSGLNIQFFSSLFPIIFCLDAKELRALNNFDRLEERYLFFSLRNAVSK